MILEPVYGPHPSRCFGASLGVDPVSFSRGCYMACAVCHSLRQARALKSYTTSELAERVARDLAEREVKVNTIYVCGSSDPFLYDDLARLLRELRRISDSVNARLVTRTPGYFQRAVDEVLEVVDTLLIPFYVADMEWDSLYQPRTNTTKSEYYGKLHELFSRARSSEKLVLEIVVARKGPESVLGGYLDEYIVQARRIGAKRVFLKTIDRPVRDQGIKPVSRRVLDMVREKLESEGVEVLACQRTQGVHRVKSKRAFVEVYNHILRKPLRVSEVSEVYGDFGVMAAESLVDKKVASKVVWENQLYYVPSR
ncbi:hypothetical protein [Thermogladius sp.]|uniref:hypothetical protein n=1 Tax=Thermogladius sp. TaxID=2023064 RepID=UPI003D0A7351